MKNGWTQQYDLLMKQRDQLHTIILDGRCTHVYLESIVDWQKDVFECLQDKLEKERRDKCII